MNFMPLASVNSVTDFSKSAREKPLSSPSAGRARLRTISKTRQDRSVRMYDLQEQLPSVAKASESRNAILALFPMSITNTPGTAALGVSPPTLLGRWLPSLRYLFSTEVHVFAFAIAANVLLAFIPFSVLLLMLCQNVLHSNEARDGVLAVLADA